MQRLFIFLTSFGSTFSLIIAKQTNNPYFVFVGAVILLAGFSYIAKYSRKPALAKEEVK